MKELFTHSLFKNRLFAIILMFLSSSTISYGQFSQLASLPSSGLSARASTFAIGNTIYVVCGEGIKGNGSTTQFYAYNTQTNQWTQKTNFPGAARYNSAGFSDGVDGYVGCGWNTGGSGRLSDIWKYSPTTDSWTQLPNFPGGARSNISGVSAVGKAYLICGRSNSSYHTDIWEFNSSSSTWTQITNLPASARWGAKAFLSNNKLYVGLGTQSTLNIFYQDFWSYDLTTNVWTQLADYPSQASTEGSHMSINGVPYVFEGLDNLNYPPGGQTLYKYDIPTDAWVAEPFNFSGVDRFYSIGESVGGIGYFGLGSTFNNTLGDFHKIIPAGSWPTDVVDIEEDFEIMVYPNPCTDILKIETSSSVEKVELQNMAGLVIESFEPSSDYFEINMKPFASGNYLLIFTDKNSMLVKNAKIMKK